MTTLLLYCRRNVGLCALVYFVARGFRVKVISDCEEILSMARNLRCEIVEQGNSGYWDWLVSVHWHRIIPEKYLKSGKGVNFHPCLYKFKGKDPVARYIDKKETMASVESHIMTKEVDDGPLVDRIMFETGIVNSYAEFYNMALPWYFRSFRRTLEKLNIEP